MRLPLTQIALMSCLVAAPASAHTDGAVAYVGPVDGILVDGSLDDWPAQAVSYALRDKGAFHGTTDLLDVDLDGSPDLDARFTLGYDAQRLYIAVSVVDDALRLGPSYKHTDACEIYLDADHSGERVVFWPNVGAGDLAALQYVAIPGHGNYSPMHPGNPSLFLAAPDSGHTRMAFSRSAGVTIYEWAIPVHHSFPDRRMELQPGQRLGFDIVVVDKDRPGDNPARVGWAPSGAYKYVNAQLLGDLVLLPDWGDVGSVHGRVRVDVPEPRPVELHLLDADGAVQARTLRQGSGPFQLHAPAGPYRVIAANARQSDTIAVQLVGATVTAVDLDVAGVDSPPGQSLLDSSWVFRAFVGALLAFALLHLMLYVFYPVLRENFVFTLFTFFTAALLFVHYQMEVGATEPATIGVYTKLFSVVSIAVFLSGLRFLYQLFMERMRRFWFFAGAGLLWIVVMWDSPFPGVFFGFLAIPEMIWITIVAIRRHNEGAWIILCGFVLLAIAWLYQALMWINVLDPVVEYVYMYGFVGLLLPMSVYLAREFAMTNHRLGIQLAEVQRLSEINLEQERRARREELERRLLEADNERKTQELEEARQMQIALLPEHPDVGDELDVAFQMHTATEVGGDYYDYQRLEDGSLVIAVGDATGHGARSSLIMATAKGLFGSLAGQVEGGELLRRMAHGIRDMKLRHLHMSLNLVHLRGRSIRIHAAGMPPVLIYRKEAQVVEEILLEAMPLGAGSSNDYPAWDGELEPGDVVLMMTDGLPERLDVLGEEFGYDRTEAAFAAAAETPAGSICDRLTLAGVEWGAGREQDDDITLVAIRVPPA